MGEEEVISLFLYSPGSGPGKGISLREGKEYTQTMSNKRGNKKGPVGGDIVDLVPKKSNGAMGFGTWESALKDAGKKRRR